MTEVVEKKKRGRKRKEDIARENIQISVSTNDNSNNIVQEPPVAKKRGRKPKQARKNVARKNVDIRCAVCDTYRDSCP